MARIEGTGGATGETREGENAEVLAGAGITLENAAELVKAAREEARKAREEAAAKVAEAKELLRAAREAAKSGPKDKTARDYVREISVAIIREADRLVREADIPDALRADVALGIANRLHHLANPADGWPGEVLPTPERSEWK